MIEVIRLKGFQSHRDTVLKLVPGINVIIGSTDSGKTAVVRAIRWVWNNRPSGDAYRSRWLRKKENTRVEIETGPDWSKVVRVKGEKENAYLVELPEQTPLELRAFKQNVPEEVRVALRLEEVNVQSQMDAPFLLSQSASEVARYLNQVAQLEVIDRAISNLNRTSRNLASSLSERQESVTSLSLQVERFGDLTSRGERLDEADELERGVGKLSSAIQLLRTTSQSVAGLELQRDSLRKSLQLEEPVRLAGELFEEVKETDKRHMQLSVLLSSIKGKQLDLKEFQKTLQLEGDVTKTEKLAQEQGESAWEVKRLRMAVETIENLQHDRQVVVEELEEAEAEYKKAIPVLCPTCERPWGKECRCGQ